MRNVTPPSDPDLILRQIKGQDQLKAYMAAAWRTLTSDLRMFIHDVSGGLYNRIEKTKQELDRWEFHQEEYLSAKLKEFRGQQAGTIGQLAQEVVELHKELIALKQELAKRKKKGERGRVLLAWQDLAAPTLTDDAARSAA